MKPPCSRKPYGAIGRAWGHLGPPGKAPKYMAIAHSCSSAAPVNSGRGGSGVADERLGTSWTM